MDTQEVVAKLLDIFPETIVDQLPRLRTLPSSRHDYGENYSIVRQMLEDSLLPKPQEEIDRLKLIIENSRKLVKDLFESILEVNHENREVLIVSLARIYKNLQLEPE